MTQLRSGRRSHQSRTELLPDRRAVGSYASNLGQNRAYELLDRPPSSRPDVAAYREKRLNLQAPGVREVTRQDPDAAYRFRYNGLKLVWRIGDPYLLLPAGWTQNPLAQIRSSRFTSKVRRTDSTRDAKIITRHPTPPPSGRISKRPIRMTCCQNIS